MPLPVAIAVLALLGGLHILAVCRRRRPDTPTVAEFLGGREQLGLLQGVTAILGFWVTGNTILAAPEVSYRFGVVGLIAYSFLGTIALLIFAPLAKRLGTQFPDVVSSGTFFRLRFGEYNYRLYVTFYFAYVMGVLVTQGVAGAIFLRQMAGVPYWAGVVFTFAVSSAYAAIGGFRGLVDLSLAQVALILLSIVVVPPLVYMNVGIPDVYQRLWERQPWALNLSSPAGWRFLVAGTVMGAGEVLIDNVFWQRARAIRPARVRLVFALAAVAWGFVPFALSTLAFVALADGLIPPSLNLVAPLVAYQHAGSSAVMLLFVAVWVAVVSTIASELNAFVHLLLVQGPANQHSKLGTVSAAHWLTLGFGTLAALFSLWPFGSLIDILVFLGVINAAYISPILFGVWSRKLSSREALIAVLAGVVLGYVVYFLWDPGLGVLISGAVSLIICIWAGLQPASGGDGVA